MLRGNLYKTESIFGIEMEVYSNFRLSRSTGYAVLKADFYLDENSIEDGNFVIGTPQCWDDVLLERVPFENFTSYHLFSYTLDKSLVSRVTDYKGVWGLAGLPRGQYGTFCDSNASRTYIGVDICERRSDFCKKRAPVVLLVPKKYETTPKDIAMLFCKPHDNFFVSPSIDFMLEVQHMFPGALMLSYRFNLYAELIVAGDGAEALFSDEDCVDWENSITLPCHHWA